MQLPKTGAKEGETWDMEAGMVEGMISLGQCRLLENAPSLPKPGKTPSRSFLPHISTYDGHWPTEPGRTRQTAKTAGPFVITHVVGYLDRTGNAVGTQNNSSVSGCRRMECPGGMIVWTYTKSLEEDVGQRSLLS